MEEKNQSLQSEFISLTQASSLVSSSKDYLTRLAREHKIPSLQKDRQWYFDKTALVNFFENKSIEDSVKKRILSNSRKNDLEATSLYRSKITKTTAVKSHYQNESLLLTILVIFGGLTSGLLLNFASVTFAKVPSANLAQAIGGLVKNFPSDTDYGLSSEKVFSDYVVSESDESIPMRDGVVIFPSEPTSSSATDLFSDEVSVVFTSTTTGFVRSNHSDVEMPFVRVPQNNYHDE